MSTAKIRYVGLKQEESAFSNVTGITWAQGTVESVDIKHVAAMLNHPDVFELAEESIGGLADAKPTPAAPVTIPTLGEAAVGEAASSTDPLDAMTREELHALAKERGIKVHHSSGAAAVIKAIRDVQPTKVE